MVELVNDLMMKQLNRVTVWERASIENKQLLPRLIVVIPVTNQDAGFRMLE